MRGRRCEHLWGLRPPPVFANLSIWAISVFLAFNALWFVLRAGSPVIQQDAWYFLNVFLRKAIEGTLGIGDFFVKREGIDHAQPMFKLVMLLEWRYFALDFVVEGVIGLLAAIITALALRQLIFGDQKGEYGRFRRLLAWMAMCILLFSLNAGGEVWIWPLVALEHLTILLTLLFFVVTWRAVQSGQRTLLAIATLILCIFNDDSGIIAVLAVSLMLLLAYWRNRALYVGRLWKDLLVLTGVLVAVRFGYTWAPVVGGSNDSSLSANLFALMSRWKSVDWWDCIAIPLVMPVSYATPVAMFPPEVWNALRALLAAVLVLAHLLFWRRLLKGGWGRQAFVAGCLMLLFYGWVAGIILGRVATFGDSYIDQPRYVIRFTVQLIALLLMWAESPSDGSGVVPRQWGGRFVVAGICALLLLQVKLSRDTWHQRRVYVAHYAAMALDVIAFTRDPEHFNSCSSELPICHWSLTERKELASLLVAHKLNVFSPQVQRWHPYLPKAR